MLVIDSNKKSLKLNIFISYILFSYIRIIFDRFLDKLSLFQQYIDAHLIEINDIRPYLLYWIEIISDPNRRISKIKFKIALWKYCKYYHFDDVIKLFKLFGYNIEEQLKFLADK